MKKTLLVILSAVLALPIFSQTVWNFSNTPFGVVGATGGTSVIDFSKNYTTTDGLTVGTDGTVLWTGLSTNNKTIDAVTYTYRLQCGGSGSPVSPSKIPSTRYLKFDVKGLSTIKIGMISSSSSATRTLIIVNADQSVVDSITNISGATASTYIYNYTGVASTLYLYSRSSGINYYYLSATNTIATSVNSAEAQHGIVNDGSQILNPEKKSLQIYNATGKLVASSNENVSTANFAKGVYIVRTDGICSAMKFSK